jgi:hypothetical protein
MRPLRHIIARYLGDLLGHDPPEPTSQTIGAYHTRTGAGITVRVDLAASGSWQTSREHHDGRPLEALVCTPFRQDALAAGERDVLNHAGRLGETAPALNEALAPTAGTDIIECHAQRPDRIAAGMIAAVGAGHLQCRIYPRCRPAGPTSLRRALDRNRGWLLITAPKR